MLHVSLTKAIDPETCGNQLANEPHELFLLLFSALAPIWRCEASGFRVSVRAENLAANMMPGIHVPDHS